MEEPKRFFLDISGDNLFLKGGVYNDNSLIYDVVFYFKGSSNFWLVDFLVFCDNSLSNNSLTF